MIFFDIAINNFLLILRTSALTKIFLWITLLGDVKIIIIFVVITILFFWFKHWRFYIAPLILSIIGSELFVFLGKLFFHRNRPEFAVYQEHSFSFPSGHATIAVVFYGFLIYLFLFNIKRLSYKISIFLIGLFFILIIGFSRLYLGVHYLSDVLAGYLLGVLWLVLGIYLSEYLVKKLKIKVISNLKF